MGQIPSSSLVNWKLLLGGNECINSYTKLEIQIIYILMKQIGTHLAPNRGNAHFYLQAHFDFRMNIYCDIYCQHLVVIAYLPTVCF
ncbi:hypothetical protein XELAEV_18027681mg [Xenopus laevis]|uniref:Uncharacterized protein n=1 Tax=Xenopus laevis TaxID=8355 RepID=A0A974HJZ1_XENLA|nr:hypothetical protein XELAEV_18027681mg [Xenopus laevis]